MKHLRLINLFRFNYQCFEHIKYEKENIEECKEKNINFDYDDAIKTINFNYQEYFYEDNEYTNYNKMYFGSGSYYVKGDAEQCYFTCFKTRYWLKETFNYIDSIFIEHEKKHLEYLIKTNKKEQQSRKKNKI